MSVVVCGSRDWPVALLWIVTLRMAQFVRRGEQVITGAAPGVDRFAHQEALRLGYGTRVFVADWHQFGKRAGFLRNLQMLDQNPRLVLAFHAGESRGTAHTIRSCKPRGIACERFTVESTQAALSWMRAA